MTENLLTGLLNLNTNKTYLFGNPTSTISLSRFVIVVFLALRRSSNLPFNVATSSSSCNTYEPPRGKINNVVSKQV